MTASDWLPVVTTVLGGLLAVGGGALVQWTSSRQSDARARDDRRRTAYVDFIAALDELMRVLRLPRPSTMPKFHDSLQGAFGGVERAAAAVILAGPPKASDVARDIRDVVWKLEEPDQLSKLEAGSETNATDIVGPFGTLCVKFNEVAQAILRTDRD